MNGPLPAGLKFRENTAKSSNYVTYSNVTLTRLEGATIITLFVIGCPKRKKSITLNINFILLKSSGVPLIDFNQALIQILK